MIGKEAFFEGIRTYFKKYSYKNTELQDFISELSAAVTKLGNNKEFDFNAWSNQWLKTPGCNEIELEYTLDAKNQITNFIVKQSPYNHKITPGNILRVQKFNITAIDENMNQVQDKNILVTTSDTE